MMDDASPDAVPMRPSENLHSLADLVPLLERLVDAFDAHQVAVLLDTETRIIEQCKDRRLEIGHELGKRVMALHEVMTRAMRIFQPRTAMAWLVGGEPYLGCVRPIDVLLTRGSAPVIEARNAIDSGGYP